MHPVRKFMFKAENKNAVLKIPHLDRVSENFVSHSDFGDKFGKIAFPWKNFDGTFGVCECKWWFAVVMGRRHPWLNER
jgi:hypothetical protein